MACRRTISPCRVHRDQLRTEAEKVIMIYNGRAEIENRIKEGENTLRWEKTSCHRFAANKAGLLLGCLALLHMIRHMAFRGQSVRPSIDPVIRDLVKVGAQSRLPCPKMVRSCSNGFSSRSALSHRIGLRLSPRTGRGRLHKTQGREGGRCFLKREKLGPLTYNLRISTGDRILLQVSGASSKFS